MVRRLNSPLTRSKARAIATIGMRKARNVVKDGKGSRAIVKMRKKTNGSSPTVFLISPMAA
jgi:hypothetical protein